MGRVRGSATSTSELLVAYYILRNSTFCRLKSRGHSGDSVATTVHLRRSFFPQQWKREQQSGFNNLAVDPLIFTAVARLLITVVENACLCQSRCSGCCTVYYGVPDFCRRCPHNRSPRGGFQYELAASQNPQLARPSSR